MTRPRRITATALAACALLSAACTHTAPRASFDPTPTPTRPGQVVTIAGAPDINTTPRDGEYALRSSAFSDAGGLAVTDAGIPYFEVIYQQKGAIAYIDRTGRIGLLRLGSLPDQLSAQGNDLWLMSSGYGINLVRASPTTLNQVTYFSWRTPLPNRLTVKDAAGRVLSGEDRRTADEYWRGSRFAVRGDGVPIVVSRRGDLYEARGGGELVEWRVPGYEKARTEASAHGGFVLGPVASDGRGGLVVVTKSGAVRVPQRGSASASRFPATARALPLWDAALVLKDGSVLLLGGAKPTEPIAMSSLLRTDGTLIRLDWGPVKNCRQFDGSLADLGGIKAGGAAMRKDGTIIVSDRYCGRILAFRLPEEMTGEAYR
ncbi:hypothetical protein [Actinomadura parmotrematis]|uniref:PQQ-binding-like beta-propeller repeat protein n=1 Tax=Actinomadura parmotrematis TaxID=2864039 RepID=A0ABS7FQ13_9ACTN|nr:hypothetical protein [Actinomadura parmotrematis]MBW8482055.1 hypothetical protein [Actinomadura parmotrematis]